MEHYDENSKEYNSNGYYDIKGNEFMSIWTFKKELIINPNTREINSKESDILISNNIETYTCNTEIGKDEKVHIFPKDELMFFYSENPNYEF